MDTPLVIPALAHFRLDQERRMRDDLETQYGKRIAQFTKAASEIHEFEDADAPPGERQFFLAEGIRLSPTVAPALYQLAHQALQHLHIDQKVEFYIYRTETPDAFCSYDRDRGIFSVCVSPEYINILDEAELLDLLGHEMGHAVLDHVQNKFLMAEDLYLDLDQWERDMSRSVLDKIEQRRVEQARAALELLDQAYLARCRRLARLQELSADRIGLLCSRDVGASLTSHMKELTGGLSSKFVRYDAGAIIRQIEELDALDRDAIDLFDGTHPITAVRMKSLMIFAQSEKYLQFIGGATAPTHGAAEADRMVDELLRQTERFPSRPSDRQLIEAVTAAAVYMLSPARGGRTLAEALEAGLYTLLEYSEIPTQWVQIDRKRAAEAAASACQSLRQSMTDKEREEALRLSLELAQMLGRPAPRLRARVADIAHHLEVAPARMQTVLHETSTVRLPSGRHGRRFRSRRGAGF